MTITDPASKITSTQNSGSSDARNRNDSEKNFKDTARTISEASTVASLKDPNSPLRTVLSRTQTTASSTSSTTNNRHAKRSESERLLGVQEIKEDESPSSKRKKQDSLFSEALECVVPKHRNDSFVGSIDGESDLDDVEEIELENISPPKDEEYIPSHQKILTELLQKEGLLGKKEEAIPEL